MFENLKSGNIEKKLIKLCRYVNKLREGKYGRDIKEFIPNINEYTNTYEYIWSGGILDRAGYTFIIDNIIYGFEDNLFVYIKVEDIVVFHNRNKLSCNGKFEEIYRGWNHKLPIEMIQQIKKDSQIINGYIRNIKDYIKQGNNTETTIKHKEEQERLNKIFCENNKER